MSLELRIPPVLLLVITAASIWGISVLLPQKSPGHPFIALLFGLTGLLIPLVGVLTFRRVGTTVDPRFPEHSGQLVQSGIFRFSRNPMYLGFLLLLVAWVVYLGNWLGALLLPLFVIYLNRFQILPEERALLEKFGDVYRAYQRRVRRWV